MSRKRPYEYKSHLVRAVGKAAGRYAYRTGKRYIKDYFRARKRARTASTRRRYIRKKPPMYRGPLTKKVIKRKLKKMCNYMKQHEAVHVHRERFHGNVVSSVKTVEYREVDAAGCLSCVEGAMTGLRFYDPGTDTLVTRNPAAQTFQNDISVQLYRKMMFKNNYQIPCLLQVFSCTPKFDTSNRPLYYFDQGMFDQGNPNNRSPLLFLNDSVELKAAWKCKRVINKVVQPGGMISCSNASKEFKYDNSVADSHNLQYQQKFEGHVWFIRVQGVLGHDTVVVAEQGIMQGGIDYIIDNTYTFKYDAGKDLHDITIDDQTASAFTNGAVCSSRPFADNIAFSRA